MKAICKSALAGASLIALSAPSFAQNAGSAPNSDRPVVSADNPGEIIVSARRREERLQDVPKVVNAVTADDLRKNNIQRLDEVASIVPGITLQNAGNGEVQNATMRGAAFDVDSGLKPTVQFYIDDANIAQNFVFQSMYDVGQLEVLRGPQGTLRGRAAPSGSITLTTKLPDLYEIGGYGDATIENAIEGRKEDYALNVPIVKGKLAVRLAGTVDDNDIAAIHPISPNPAAPYAYAGGPFDRTWSERASVRALPVDSLELNVMYQHLVNRQQNYLQTESTCLIDPSQPCGTGPLITPGDRLSTVNGQRKVYQNSDVLNGRADWEILGQKLSYVGQYAIEHITDEEPEDGADVFSGQMNPDQKFSGVRNQFQSHEARLSSEERIAHIFDYTAGYFTYYTKTNVFGGAGPEAQAIAFAYSPSGNEGFNSDWEISEFANITAHPTQKLELSGGARHILAKSIPPGSTSVTRVNDTIWNASASYHFAPEFMGYVNAGSSFRPQGSNLGFAYLPFQVSVPARDAYAYLPTLADLPANFSQLQAEKSTSYEIGIKSQFLDRRLTLNLDYYHQKYKNYQFVSPDYISGFLTAYPQNPYTNPDGLLSTTSPQIVLGTENVPAKVDGVEGDINYRFAQEGNLGASFSYADGRITGGAVVPCAGPVSAATPVATCPAGPMSYAPRFGATLHGDYARPVTSQIAGFLRGQASIYGATPFNPGNPYDKQPAYALVNLYAGVRAPNSAWELTFFVKNLFANETRLATYGGNINAQTPQSVGANGTVTPTTYSSYTYIAVAPPRIFGVEVRYAFGSR